MVDTKQLDNEYKQLKAYAASGANGNKKAAAEMILLNEKNKQMFFAGAEKVEWGSEAIKRIYFRLSLEDTPFNPIDLTNAKIMEIEAGLRLINKAIENAKKGK